MGFFFFFFARPIQFTDGSVDFISSWNDRGLQNNFCQVLRDFTLSVLQIVTRLFLLLGPMKRLYTKTLWKSKFQYITVYKISGEIKKIGKSFLTSVEVWSVLKTGDSLLHLDIPSLWYCSISAQIAHHLGKAIKTTRKITHFTPSLFLNYFVIKSCYKDQWNQNYSSNEVLISIFFPPILPSAMQSRHLHQNL